MRGSANTIQDAAVNGQAGYSDAVLSTGHDAARRPAYSSVQWARHSYLELGVLPTAVPCARGHASLVVGEWGLAAMAETIELVVSELARPQDRSPCCPPPTGSPAGTPRRTTP
jgi:hypothetical protein